MLSVRSQSAPHRSLVLLSEPLLSSQTTLRERTNLMATAKRSRTKSQRARAARAGQRREELEQKIVSSGGLPEAQVRRKRAAFRVHPNSTAATKWGRSWWEPVRRSSSG